MRPTGDLHMGNFIGALENWVKMQDQYDCHFMIADLHMLTDRIKTDELTSQVRRVTLDWLSAGIDPEKSVLFRQSDVHEHAELYLLLGMVTPVGWLTRCPTYKDTIMNMKIESPGYGLLGYPVLMCADIALYGSSLVPVGEDQVAHLEIAREIIRRFNRRYDRVFVEPEPLLSRSPKLLGTDGRKMSKSYGNCIYLTDTPEQVSKKVLPMPTDPARVRRNDPGTADKCPVFAYHKTMGTDDLDYIEKGCRTASIGCVDCKKILLESIERKLDPIRQRRKQWEKDPDAVDRILEKGAEKARETASKTMKNVWKAVGFRTGGL